MQPSIKGAALAGAHARIQELIEEGVISREILEIELDAQTLTLIDSKLEPSLWYSTTASERMSRLLLERDGHGDPSYLIDTGRGTASRFIQDGIFRSFIEEALKHRGNEGPALLKMTELVFSFGRWRFEGESLADFRVTMNDASAMPEMTRLSCQGFMEAMAAYATSSPIRVTSSRPRPDQIIFEGHAV